LTVLYTGWSGVEFGGNVLSGVFHLINKINRTLDTTKKMALFIVDTFFVLVRSASVEHSVI
jgi:hypothetical protein